ncbi:MAG: DUF1905 domain-containing protein [Jatrophihabitans sp.]
MECEFSGELWYWRGPAPFYFITVPDGDCLLIKELSAEVSYGWGVIPATIRIGATEWTTSLFPKDGRYLVPIKVSVRRAEDIEDGDLVTVRLSIGGLSIGT